jgi:nucleotide-binding universal stress UspA family protein
MPERAGRRLRVILHATDFSRASGPAFVKALELARSTGAELLLAHVLSPVILDVGYGSVSGELYQQVEGSNRAYGDKELASLVAKAKKAGVRAKPLLLTGTAHEQIAKAARARRADMIVIGTHGRTGLARLFVGSVASRVVSSAPCPVMTVRGR